MNDTDLQLLVEKISLEYFHKTFKHRAYFNKRLRTTGGRYLLQSHNIDINYKYYDVYGEAELIGIIKHELCHYHLHIEGKGYRHSDGDFKNLLKEVGAPRYCTPILDKTHRNSTLYYYECSDCKFVYTRKKRVNIERYVCGKCKGKLKLIKKI